MDQFIKQDETGDLIETGMNVANHFLSAPIQGTNSLSKATIIPGVAPVLIGNPEQKNIQYPTASHQGSKSKGRSSGARPIIVSSSEVGTGGTQIPEPLFAQTGQGGTVTTVYQDPTIQPTGSYRSVELAKIGKERMINRFVEKPRTSTPVTEFKRGGPGAAAQGQTIQEEGIDGNGASAGSKERSGSLSGATPYAHLSLPQQDSTPANVGIAQQSAISANEIMDLLRGMDARLQHLEQKVDKVLAQGSMVTQIKNELSTVKTTLATIEGMMATVKIMDPGNPTGVPVDELRRSFSDHVTIVSGPGDVSFSSSEEPTLYLDELARPIPKPRPAKQPKPQPVKDLAGRKVMITKMITDCVANPQMKQAFEQRLAKASTEDALNDIKRDIIRSAI
uniref:Phosphoprotein n=2 Tax=Mumps orthorubulavirus TaxID=2560602 RepID=Q9DQA3_MUMPV|nr:phospho protein [Mumps orthorubulavirus]AUN87696.1 phosphoprotein [Mumps virus genotype G]AAP74200.1 phosphoprotein [Mumps orthorubulavirus]AUN87699.1 phosphoprotein [Mumps virus genotype G]QOJ54918.1 phosphoprotein [Mumps virus genotype G]